MEASVFLSKVKNRVLSNRAIQLTRHHFKESVLIPTIARFGWRLATYIPIQEASLSPVYGFDDEQAIKDATRQVRGSTMASLERIASLWQQVKYVDKFNIPGALVECGVWKGGTAGVMALAHANRNSKPTRHVHLFDSFEGLPEPVEQDGLMAKYYSKNRNKGKLNTIGKCVGTLDENKSLFAKLKYPSELVHYHVGWFQDTLPKDRAALGPIAVLRLDGDWYESTKACLEHLYPLVVPGGIVIIDDYGVWEGCKRAVDEFIDSQSKPILLNHADMSCRFWIKV